MKLNFKGIIESIKDYAVDNKPELLTGIGIVCGITAGVIAVKATPKALQLLEEKKEELEVDTLPVVDTVKTTWKCYAPAMVMGGLSITCIVSASSMNAKRQAALFAAYKLSETALADYKEATVETVGERKEKDIRHAVAQKQVDRNPVVEQQVILTEKGSTLCLDPLTGRYFKSDSEQIRKAENEINRRLNYDYYVSLNDFYELLGLETTDLGEVLGWNSDDGLLHLDFLTRLTNDDTPCLVIDYNIMPRYEYYKMIR